MIQREFHSTEELDTITESLATASQHPVYTDLGREYEGEIEGTDEMSPIEDLRPQPDLTMVWNNREDVRAYISSDEYELVQHEEVLDMIRDAVDQTVGSIDFGMIRDYGSVFDGILVFGNQDEASINLAELLGDDYLPPEERPETDPTATTSRWRDAVGIGMRFQNSWDGSKKIMGSTMGYRYICQNWMVWNEQTIGRVERAHVGEIGDDFFEDLIFEVFDTKTPLSTIILQAENNELPLDWVPGVLEQAGFGKQYQKRIGARVLGQRRYRDSATTMWRLYNAATYELDHEVAPESTLTTYNVHQNKAWRLITSDPEAPEEEVDLEEFVGDRDIEAPVASQR